MTEENLQKRKQYDEFKRQKCKENNILLIEIPEFNKKLKPETLPNFVEKTLTENMIAVDYNLNIDLANFWLEI